MAQKRYKFIGTGLTNNERKWGQRKFKEYEKLYSIERLSDLSLLEQLIYLEVLERRYKNRIQELDEYNKTITSQKDGEEYKKPIIPKNIREALQENLEQQLILKEKLNFFADKTSSDAYKYIELLKKKFEHYQKSHPMEFSVKCPKCNFLFFLNRKTTDYKPNEKLELFDHNILLNKSLWNMFKNKEVTKEQVAKILCVSIDYVNWLSDNIDFEEINKNK